jgi:hypothetical protein
VAENGGDGSFDKPWDRVVDASTTRVPGAVIFVYSGTYDHPTRLIMKPNEHVIGQGIPGASFTDYVALPAPSGGSTPTPPDLSAGTKPVLILGTGVPSPNGGADGFFVDSGTVRNFKILGPNFTEANPFAGNSNCVKFNNWTSSGGLKPGDAVLIDRVDMEGCNSTWQGSNGSTLNITNSTLEDVWFSVSNHYGTNLGLSVTFNATSFTNNGSIWMGIHASGLSGSLFFDEDSPVSLNFSSSASCGCVPGIYAGSTNDTTGQITFNGSVSLTSNGPTPLILQRALNVTFNGPVTLSNTHAAYTNGQSANIGTSVVTFNGPLSVVTNAFAGSNSVGLNVSNSTITMKDPNSTITTTNANGAFFTNVVAGANGMFLKNVNISGGRLFFNSTSGGPISVTGGTIDAGSGGSGQPCVSRNSAPNVTVSGITGINCTP